MPVPKAPALPVLRALERLRLHPPFTSENVLALSSMRPVPTASDLERLGLELRTVRESLDDLLQPLRHGIGWSP